MQRICVAYDGMSKFFPKEKIVHTGNPIRQDLLDISSKREEAQSFFNLDPNKMTLLVLGGSLGARKINELINNHLEFFETQGLQVIWQCGKLYEEAYVSKGTSLVQVHTFLNRMDLAYAAADIIVSRAGALSVSELCIVGKPVIFIPSPNVAEDHQTKNAMAICEKNAALLLRESEAESTFQQALLGLLQDNERTQELSKNIKELAKPNATKDIVDEIEKLIRASS